MAAFATSLSRGLLAASALLTGAGVQAQPAAASPALRLEPCRIAGVEEELRCGIHHVFEDRGARHGRTLPLRVVLIPARDPLPERPPIFIIFGGPGQTATSSARFVVGGWERENHDVVLVDQRGTGEGHRLDCRIPGSDPQSYLEPLFVPALFRACRAELESEFNLSLYTTPLATDDLDEIRRALGYEQILLAGGSYGSRFVLTYIRRHGDHVRAAIMNGLVPFDLRNPLYHARGAQAAWDGLVGECRADPVCAAAYPNLAADFATLRARLRERPARVRLATGSGEEPVEVSLSEEAFGEALRVMLYRADSARGIPLLISRALDGDFVPFATTGLEVNRRLRDQLRLGMLLSVVCSEDVARIRPEDVARETRDTFLGDIRVRQQMAVCADWPRGALPADYAAPFRSEVPVLLMSGNLDPVTPPIWGDLTARYFANVRHITVPGGHLIDSSCTDAISRAFFAAGSAEGLDTSCVSSLRPPPFALPEAVASRRTEASRAR